VAFLVAFIGLQAAVGGIFGRAVAEVEHVEPADTARTVPATP
jgi:hypothetical protein